MCPGWLQTCYIAEDGLSLLRALTHLACGVLGMENRELHFRPQVATALTTSAWVPLEVSTQQASMK